MILVDTSEPTSIIALLQQSAPVSVLPLNQTQRSDYYFGGEDGKTRQFGRVQAGELLGNIDSMEDELRRYYNNADENNQIVEGLISSVPLTRRHHKGPTEITIRGLHRLNAMFSYRVTDSGFIYDEHSWDISASLFYAWIFRLEQSGVFTYYTENFVGTARLLAAIYHNCQKPPGEHSTLNRYYIPKVGTGEQDIHGRRIAIKEQNPFIRALMSLSLIYGLNIGGDKATRISLVYKNLFDVAMAEVNELCMVSGVGKKTAEKLLIAIGREL